MSGAVRQEGAVVRPGHRGDRWAVAAVSAAPVALLTAWFVPPVGAVVALAAVVLAVIALGARPTRHRRLLETALVTSAAALLWSLLLATLLVSSDVEAGDEDPEVEVSPVFTTSP